MIRSETQKILIAAISYLVKNIVVYFNFKNPYFVFRRKYNADAEEKQLHLALKFMYHAVLVVHLFS